MRCLGTKWLKLPKPPRRLCASALRRELLLLLFVAMCCHFITCASIMADELELGPTVPDAAKIVGPEQGAKCHQPEVQQWMRTPHFATFDSLHRNPRAKEIADKLGVK